jgi:hypothetical protein
MSKMIRSPIFIIVCVFAFLGFIFATPLRFPLQTRYWEFNIRRNQDPKELQAWAVKLLEQYRTSNVGQRGFLLITNKPPANFPVAHADVSLISEKPWGGAGYYIKLQWYASSFGGRWGLIIGETNYVCSLPDEWKPGIYFFSGP